ncbi:MAG: zinc protease [Bacilli bacterium]|nr:zinc protease [Bacilli bacterium]
MKKYDYDQIGESLVEETLPNGLRVAIMPKPKFNQVFATFSTDYGSIDREFIIPGQQQPTVVPDGIAHFLEHKMFEEEDGDVFQRFARYGASANAFTTFDMTTYLFSATEHISEHIETLIDFVQRTYLTDENVDKEKGIIGQEIRMYDDNPDWRSFFGVLQGLFHDHPVKIDIAGTVESISKITKETLLTCYRTFYHPSNMILTVVGPVDPDVVLDQVRRNQEKKQFDPQEEIRRIYPQEPATVAKRRVENRLSVSIPRVLFGYKEPNETLRGRALLEKELVTAVALDALFSRSANLFNELYDAGLIDRGFSWEYEATPAYSFSVIGGQSPEPDRLISTINERLKQIQAEGLSEELFEIGRRKLIGKFLEAIDSPQLVARQIPSYRFKGIDYLDTLPTLQAMTPGQVNDRLRSYLQPDTQAVSIVWPVNSSN